MFSIICIQYCTAKAFVSSLRPQTVLRSHLVSWFFLDNGVILKILEDGSKAFIISETHLCNGSAPVHSMKLDSEKVIKQPCESLNTLTLPSSFCCTFIHCSFCLQRKLFVGYPGQISVLDLQRCQDYNASCEECVLSRDPYCAWTEQGCTSQTKQAFIFFGSGVLYYF